MAGVDNETLEALVARLSAISNEKINQLEGNMDTFFVIVMSMIVFFLQCGFAFLEAGCVRSKNTTNILLKNLLDSLIGCFIYWAIGYPLAFGEGNAFIGHTGWFGTYPEEESSTWLFQFVFAATACTIVSGSVAERCDIWPYFLYSILITGIVYPVVSHWAWGGGWLGTEGTIIEGIAYSDFAGSGVVHMTGGIAALFGAIFCGPRLGRFELGSVNNLPGHSIPLAALGAFILIFGFLAFNGGSQFSIAQPGDGQTVALVINNTLISGMGAAITTFFITKFVGFLQEKVIGLEGIKSSWSILVTINGVLVGMVGICGSCNAVSNWSAFIIGIISAFFYFGISMGLIKLRIDDPLDAVAVHAGGGLWGVLATPLFSSVKDETIDAGKQFAVNLVGAIAIILWASAWSAAIFGSMKAFKVLRVPRLVELKGMDVEKHGEPAYPVAAWKEAWGEFNSKSGSGHLVNSIFSMSIAANDSKANSLDNGLEQTGRSEVETSSHDIEYDKQDSKTA